jgi:hypothetical protein
MAGLEPAPTEIIRRGNPAHKKKGTRMRVPYNKSSQRLFASVFYFLIGILLSKTRFFGSA